MAYYLGIDVGTSGTKTLLVDQAGKVVAEASAGYLIEQPRAGWTQQNPDDWWDATVKTVNEVVSKAGVDKADVRSIGLSGQMHGSVFLDAGGKVLRPAILWNDQRTADQCGAITDAAGGRESLVAMVANPALTGFQAPKILWLRDHEPEHFEKLRQVLLPKDEIRRRMIGESVTEVSDASGTLLLDVKNRRWSSELLSKLNLPASLLPRVVESEDVTGTLSAAAARTLGLTTKCTVVGGAGDCAAGAIGNGIVAGGLLSTSIGTSGVMFVHSDEPVVDPAGRLHTFCHAVRGKWHLMGVNLTSGGALQWWVESVLAGLDGDKPYDLATKEAQTRKPGAGGLVFLPYLSGERTPHADPRARGVFAGLATTHTRGDLTRSIMEGVTFALRDSLEIFRSMGVPVDQIRASGGGSENPFWRQMQADVFGQNVTTLRVSQGPAYGVALLAMVGDGVYPSIQTACETAMDVAGTTDPHPAAARIYDELFPIYQSLYRANAEAMHALAAIADR